MKANKNNSNEYLCPLGVSYPGRAWQEAENPSRLVWWEWCRCTSSTWREKKSPHWMAKQPHQCIPARQVQRVPNKSPKRVSLYADRLWESRTEYYADSNNSNTLFSSLKTIFVQLKEVLHLFFLQMDPQPSKTSLASMHAGKDTSVSSYTDHLLSTKTPCNKYRRGILRWTLTSLLMRREWELP